MTDTFVGFDPPTENWSKLPHALIDALPLITSEAEAKVILYVLRHTWGYRDTDKRISNDEFVAGRKRKDGSRIDGGTGLSENAVKDGLRRAILHGFVEIETDQKDRARVRHYYRLHMRQGSEVDPPQVGYQSLIPRVSEVDTLPSEVDTRSEKETHRNKQQAENENAPQRVAVSLSPAHLHLVVDVDYLSALLRMLDISGPKSREIKHKKPDPCYVLAHALYAASRGYGAGWIITEVLAGAIPSCDFLGFARLSPDEWRALWRGATRGEWNTCPPQLYAGRSAWLQAFEGIFEHEPFTEIEIEPCQPIQAELPESPAVPDKRPMTEWEHIWINALNRLNSEMTTTTFDTYLKDTRVINEQCNGKLVVSLIHWRLGHLEVINNRLHPMIERAVNEIAGRAIEVEFVEAGKK